MFMEPGEGIGPSTSSLPWKRSTTELPRQVVLRNSLKTFYFFSCFSDTVVFSSPMVFVP